MSTPTATRQPSLLLHREIFDIMLLGARMRDALEASARQSAAESAETYASRPPISIVIRTRNNGRLIEDLLEDIRRQDYSGEVQIILADTESADDTVAIARAAGRSMNHEITVVPIAQHGFNYPATLNQAFCAADNPFILSLVGHERLSNTRTLDAAARGAGRPSFGGSFGPALPNANSTRAEQAGAIMLGTPSMLKERCLLAKIEVGALASDRAIISREAWRELGGYNVAYGAGGEDGDLARRIMAAGMDVTRDPVLATHHTHGLGPARSLIQLIEWYRISRPREFSPWMHRLIRPPRD